MSWTASAFTKTLITFSFLWECFGIVSDVVECMPQCSRKQRAQRLFTDFKYDNIQKSVMRHSEAEIIFLRFTEHIFLTKCNQRSSKAKYTYKTSVPINHTHTSKNFYIKHFLWFLFFLLYNFFQYFPRRL